MHTHSISNRVIAFEGNIGSGKSTLCEKFKSLYPDRCSIYKEQGNEKFLQLFYSNPSKYGFAYQWGMLKTRRFQLAMAQHDKKYGRLLPREFYFWDRSMIGDYIFAVWNHLLGSISKEEMAVYEDEFGGSINNIESVSALSDVDCYVLLNDEPRRCKYRVENIRGNKSEEGIPLSYYEFPPPIILHNCLSFKTESYLQGIDDLHFDFFVNRLIPTRIAPTIVLSWGHYNNPVRTWNEISKIVSGETESVQIRNINKRPQRIGPKGLLYETEADVNSFYQSLQSSSDDEYIQKHVFERCHEIDHIFIPRSIMTVRPEDKGIILDHNSYNIRFYQNAYKRVVLWHLSQSHEIRFYD